MKTFIFIFMFLRLFSNKCFFLNSLGASHGAAQRPREAPSQRVKMESKIKFKARKKSKTTSITPRNRVYIDIKWVFNFSLSLSLSLDFFSLGACLGAAQRPVKDLPNELS